MRCVQSHSSEGGARGRCERCSCLNLAQCLLPVAKHVDTLCDSNARATRSGESIKANVQYRNAVYLNVIAANFEG
jgi:hypothetical protein